jgi:hypothetical protein
LPADLTGAKSWGSVSATDWLTPVWGVVAAAGSYPVDPSQGFPGGRFVSLGVRLATARRNAPSIERRAIKGPEAGSTKESPGVGQTFRIAKIQGNTVLRFRAPSATRVEMTGDFTQWVPVDLQRSTDGWWTASLRTAPGTYQMNFRIDGGPWMVPPGMLSMKDEFGGETGLLVVE